MYRRLIIIFIALTVVFINSINIESEDLNEDRFIKVEIKGEVERPGIYELKLGSSLQDLFLKAGLTKDADTSQYSLNSILHNSQVIVVGKTRNDLISINSAGLDELTRLPGIGPGIAQRIIDYRNTYGSFNNLEELKNVKGIGDGKFSRIKEYICL